jgi:hypothetical protein
LLLGLLSLLSRGFLLSPTLFGLLRGLLLALLFGLRRLLLASGSLLGLSLFSLLRGLLLALLLGLLSLLFRGLLLGLPLLSLLS